MQSRIGISRLWLASLVILVVSAALLVAYVDTRPRTTEITSVVWSNPSGFCLPITAKQGSQELTGTNTTVSLAVNGSTSELQGCYVQAVTVNTPGFSLVSSDAPGMIGTWTPLSVTVRNPSGGYRGGLNITVDVVPANGSSPVPQLAIASSNFQLNSTGGVLFATFVNIGNSNVSASQFLFDNQTLDSSNSNLESSCTNVASEKTCTVTFYFGNGLLPVPVDGSEHQLSLVTGSGAAMKYTVTAGELEQQDWASEE